MASPPSQVSGRHPFRSRSISIPVVIVLTTGYSAQAPGVHHDARSVTTVTLGGSLLALEDHRVLIGRRAQARPAPVPDRAVQSKASLLEETENVGLLIG